MPSGHKFTRNAFESRKNIKETWAKDAPSYMTMRYLIADPPKDKKDSNTTIEEDKILEKEQLENGDLIFIRGFEDTYGHIHLKWYAGLEWHQQFCPRVDWILKTDDDTVVHLPRLDYWIEHKFRGELAKNPATFFGFINDGMEAIRDNRSKWYVSEQDFPGKMFPIYLRGATYLASRPAISATMPHTNKTNGFNMDDVLYTGILAELGNVSLSRHNDKFGLYLLGILEGKEKMDCEDGFPKTISMFGIKPANMSEAYKLLWTQKCDQRSIEKLD